MKDQTTIIKYQEMSPTVMVMYHKGAPFKIDYSWSPLYSSLAEIVKVDFGFGWESPVMYPELDVLKYQNMIANIKTRQYNKTNDTQYNKLRVI